MEFCRSNYVYEVTDLAHLHVHDKILGVDRIQRVTRVVGGRSVNRSHQNLFLFLLSHVHRGSLVINLHRKSLLTFAIYLLVHDLDILEAASVLSFFILDRDDELVFECLQVKLLWFHQRQFPQGPVLILFTHLDIHIFLFVD